MLAMTEYDELSRDKKPSTKLISLIAEAANTLLDFGELWNTIKTRGNEEGFSDKELQDMLKPFLKNKLNSKKIWYLFHKDEQIERVQTAKSTKFSTNAAKNVLEQSDEFEVPSDLPITSLDNIIMKSEGEIAEAEYQKEMKNPIPETNYKQITLDEIFNFLPNDDGMTSWKSESVTGSALKNRITSWQGNSQKYFRVWMQEIHK